MSNLGHIRGDIPQTRAKSRGAEACHCTEIIHVLITLPVSQDESSAELLLSSRLSTLWSNLCLTQHESLIARRRSQTHQHRHFLILIPSAIPHCPDNTFIYQPKSLGYRAAARPWLDCLSHERRFTLLISAVRIRWLIIFARLNVTHLGRFENVWELPGTDTDVREKCVRALQSLITGFYFYYLDP